MSIRKLLFIVISLISISAIAQTNGQLAERIRGNSDYLYGDGFGKTFSEADQSALANLISKIATNLSSEFNQTVDEINTNGEIDSKTAVNIIVKSYSQASLANTKSLMLDDASEFHVFRYIAKSELEKIFNQRKEKMLDMVRRAQKAEEKLKIDDALRYYYWSFTLLKSLQYPNEVVYSEGGVDHKLMVWIPERINSILEGLTARVAEVSGNDAMLYFTYKGKPVASIDFTFYNGNSWTMLNSAKNGVANIELRPGVDVKTLKIRYEYEYAGETQIDPEMALVANIFKGTTFRRAELVLNDKAGNVKGLVSKETGREQTVRLKEMADIKAKPVEETKAYNTIITAIVNAVTKNNYQQIRSYFTNEGWDMMDRLLHYGRAKLIGKQDYAFYDLGNGRTVCRSLAMAFCFPNNNKTFTEDVTFTFNADKKIECVAFGLGMEAKTDIFDKCVGLWSEESKMIIATFLENYKTAFALKRLDYIKSIFDDNAVIITGHVTKQPVMEGSAYIGNNEIVRYNRQTKEQYIKNLTRCFANNQFVNIRFTDNDVVKMGIGGEVYGIQIHQDYFSSTYGDTGYLFLMVDINNPDQPIIKVRTWQPERDPNINSHLPHDNPDYGIIGPGNF